MMLCSPTAACEQVGSFSFPTLDDNDLVEVLKPAAEGPSPCQMNPPIQRACQKGAINLDAERQITVSPQPCFLGDSKSIRGVPDWFACKVS